MELTNAVRERILQLCEDYTLAPEKLAEMAALPTVEMDAILHKTDKEPKLSTIQSICNGLDMTLGAFFSTPAFDNLELEAE